MSPSLSDWLPRGMKLFKWMKEEFEVSITYCEMWRWCRRIWRIFVKDKPSVFLQVAVNSWSFSTSCRLLAKIPSPPSFVLPWNSCLWRLDCKVLGKGLVSSPLLAVQRVTARYINRTTLLHEWVWTCVSEDRRDKLKGNKAVMILTAPHISTAKWNWEGSESATELMSRWESTTAVCIPVSIVSVLDCLLYDKSEDKKVLS